MSEISDSNELLICLKNTYLSLDNNLRINSEKKLSTLKNENITEFVTNLIKLLKIKTPEIDRNLRLSIILLLKRSITEKLDSNKKSKEEINNLIQQYLIIMVDTCISNKELENLKDTFILILDNTCDNTLIEILKYLKTQLTLIPLGSVNGVISILSSILYTSDIIINKELFISFLNLIFEMASDILQNTYKKYNEADISKISKEDYIKFNSMFYNIFTLFLDLCMKAKKREIKFKNEKNKNIIKYLDEALFIGIKLLVDLNTKDSNRIISWTGIKNIDKSINSMRISIFKYMNFNVNELSESNIDSNEKENHNQLIQIVILNLEWVIINKYTYIIKLDTDINYPDYSYSLLISFMFIYLKRILNKKFFINEYTSKFNILYKNILLPLLIMTDMEEKMALDETEVNNYLIDIDDIIYFNKHKRIKSSIGGLIKKFYCKNEGSNSFMIKYTINLIYYLIEETRNLSDTKNFDDNDIVILLLKHFNKNKIICALFLALNIFSENENKENKKNNYIILISFFSAIFPIIAENYHEYPLLQFQLIIFIKNYSYKLFNNDINVFEIIIKYLFEALFNTDHILISNSAGDALQKLFDISEKEGYDDNIDNDIDINNDNNIDIKGEKKLKINIKNILVRIASKNSKYLEKYILEIKITNFFDVLYQIITNYAKVDNFFFKNIFINLCQRINNELQKYITQDMNVDNADNNQTSKNKHKSKHKSKNKKNDINEYNNIIINKCFNIIKYLIENKAFRYNNSDVIENWIIPLIKYINNLNPLQLNEIYFDEDIIYIVNILMNFKGNAVGSSFTILKYLSKYINKIGGIDLAIYQLIDSLLKYCSNEIICNPRWYNEIFEAFKSGIKTKKDNKSGLYTCILIQTWIIKRKDLPQKCVGELIEEIIKNIIIILTGYYETKDINYDIYNFLGFTTTIITGLINYNNIVTTLLKKYSKENEIQNWIKIIIKENDILFQYEIKLIIYSINHIIRNGIIKGDFGFLLNLCLELLLCQKNNSKKEIKKSNKKMMDMNFIEDDDEDNKDDNYDDNNEEISDYKEMKDIINKTTNDIKNIDEFKYFNELLQYLKNNKNEIYLKWENSFNQEQKNKIINLISTKRINIQINSNDMMMVARRIVAIKRNKEN